MKKENSLPFADKNLGQHFLVSEKFIDLITEGPKENYNSILEIGPGPGILTHKLLEKNILYRAIEKDERFKEYLPLDKVIFCDALTVDLNTFIKEQFLEGPIWLVSNLPYNISVPLIRNFLEITPIKNMTLMVQKEVALRLLGIDSKGHTEMNSLCSLVTNYFDCELLCHVPPGAFKPPPKVTSTVLTLKRKKDPIISLIDINKYESFLRGLFSHRRKQVGKVLKGIYGKERAQKAIEDANLDLTLRAETFSIDSVRLLYQLLV